MRKQKVNSTVTISAKIPKEVSEYIDGLVKYSGLTKSEIIKNAIMDISLQNRDLDKTKNRLQELFYLNQISLKFSEISAYCKKKNMVDFAVLNQLKIIEGILIKKDIDDL